MALSAVAASKSVNNKNIEGVAVKEEKPEDAEINEIAAKIKEQNKAKMAVAQAQSQHPLMRTNQPSGSQGALGLLLSNNSKPADTTSSQVERQPSDYTSRRGKFGWTTLGGEDIPYIMRGDDKYVAVRMVEVKVLHKYLNYLSPELYSCTSIRSYYITDAESRLLNEINFKHCDSKFGSATFTPKDLVVMFEDSKEFYEFLDLCYTKLVNPLSPDTKERCGFVRINKDSVVPYTIRDGEKFVPLFYFEGETDALMKKAATLGPWHLAYLKFCCKIQGIRNELFSNDNCNVISLLDIKSYFPPGTVFDEYWPPKLQSSQLCALKNSGIRPNWTSVAGPSPVSTTPSVDATRMVNSQAAVTNGWQSTQQRYQEPLSSPRLAQTANMVSPNTSVIRGSPTTLHYPYYKEDWPTYTAPPISNMSISSLMAPHHIQYSAQHNNNNGQKHPPPLIPVTNTPRYYRPDYVDLSSPPHSPLSRVSRQVPVDKPMYSPTTQHYAQRILNNKAPIPANYNFLYPSHYESLAQQKKVETKKKQEKTVNGWHSLTPIMDTSNVRGNGNPPYKLQKALVVDKMVPCINAKPNLFSELVMTVNDLLSSFFPQISIDKCQEVLQNVLNIRLYAANPSMKMVLLDNKKIRDVNETVPLVQLKDVIQFMPQLRYIMEDQSGGNPTKRPRIAQS